MKHNMKLDSDSFERIKNKKKKIEVRLFDDKRKKIQIGDEIVFSKIPDLKESVKAKVIGLSRFNTFKDLFSVFGTKPFGHPEDMSVEEQVKGMRSAYSPEKEKEYTVIGIHIII